MLDKKLHHYFETIWVLAKADIKIRYQGSFLGIFWVFLKPFGIFLILNFVFSSFFKDTPNYPIRLLTGVVLWSLFSDATLKGMLSLDTKSYILKKVFVPKWVVIFSSILHSGIVFFFNLLILFLFLFLYYRIFPGFGYILIFLFYVTMIYGISLIFALFTAPIYIRFRDLDQIWELMLQILFFATPIIYPIDIIPDNFKTIIKVNPMAFLIQHSRDVLIDQDFSQPYLHLIFIGLFIGLLVGGIFFLKKSSKFLVEKM
jgi:ABC-2 type transport system permease protein